MFNQIVPIDSNNVDYYQWGRNCMLLDFDEKLTLNIIDTFPNETQEDIDMFFSGYYTVK